MEFDGYSLAFTGDDGVVVWDADRIRALRGDDLALLTQILDVFGKQSAVAQGLGAPVTDVYKLRSTDQRLYLYMYRQSAKTVVLGGLKVGTKSLFMRTVTGDLREIQPVCVLDFYVHESCQRQGIGKQLFERFLATEGLTPACVAYDRPSPKLLAFLHKHYGVRDHVPQSNNYVLFNQFWELNPPTNTRGRASYLSTPPRTSAAPSPLGNTPSSAAGTAAGSRFPLSAAGLPAAGAAAYNSPQPSSRRHAGHSPYGNAPGQGSMQREGPLIPTALAYQSGPRHPPQPSHAFLPDSPMPSFTDGQQPAVLPLAPALGGISSQPTSPGQAYAIGQMGHSFGQRLSHASLQSQSSGEMPCFASSATGYPGGPMGMAEQNGPIMHSYAEPPPPAGYDTLDAFAASSSAFRCGAMGHSVQEIKGAPGSIGGRRNRLQYGPPPFGAAGLSMPGAVPGHVVQHVQSAGMRQPSLGRYQSTKPPWAVDEPTTVGPKQAAYGQGGARRRRGPMGSDQYTDMAAPHGGAVAYGNASMGDGPHVHAMQQEMAHMKIGGGQGQGRYAAGTHQQQHMDGHIQGPGMGGMGRGGALQRPPLHGIGGGGGIGGSGKGSNPAQLRALAQRSGVGAADCLVW